MIYCPNCGTANRDGSGFCNQCGNRLAGGSRTACPSCGSDNPIENIFCNSCGAKLAPLVTKGVEEKPGVKGFSLPSKPIEDAPLPEAEDVPGEGVTDAEEDDIPDWLARLRASTNDEGGAASEERAETVPEPPADQPIESAGGDAGEEAPEWLAQLTKTEPAASEVEPEVETPPHQEEMAAETEAPAPEVIEEPALAEPLAAEPSVEDAAGALLGAAVVAAAEDVAVKPPDQESAEEIPSEAAPPEQESAAVSEPAEPAEITAPVSEADKDSLAAWMQQEGPVILESDEEDDGEEEIIVFKPEKAAVEPLPPSEIPAWLEPLAPEGAARPEEMGAAFTPPGKPSPEEVGLERAEIPDWIEALRPGSKMEAEQVPEEPVEAGGILGGMRGVLRMVEDVDPTPGQQTRPVSAPVSVTAAHAEMLTRLLGEPTSSLAKPRAVSTAARPSRGLPWLAFLLLLAAVILPVFVPGLVPGGSTAPASGAAADLAAQIHGLQQGDTVLLSMDYDPGASTELDWPVRMVLEDLKARGVNLLVTSLMPTGSGLASRFDMSGMQTILLGYLPGQEMGLQRLATGLEGVFVVDFYGNSVPQSPFGVRSLNDISLIITAASSQDTVRWWVEQVRTQASAPMVAVISAAVEPGVRPYYASGQLAGLVSGWVGGQAYRQVAAPDGASSRQDVAAMEAQSMAHLVIALLIVLGNFAYWGKRLFGRQPS